MALIEELRRRQGQRSQEEFAKEIGITQAQLSRIYSGDRRLGKHSAKRICAAFPELRFQVADHLLEDDTGSSVA